MKTENRNEIVVREGKHQTKLDKQINVILANLLRKISKTELHDFSYEPIAAILILEPKRKHLFEGPEHP